MNRLPLFALRPSFKVSFSCVSALLLFAAQANAQVTTVTETLQNITSANPTLTLPDFAGEDETLVDVTFTLMLGSNPVTVFDAEDPGDNLINVSFMPATSNSGFINGDILANWNISPTTLEIAYTEDTSNASKYGGAAQFLFGTHSSLADRFLEVNFDTIPDNVNNNGGGTPIGGDGTNPNGGGSPVTPEPSVKYLSLIAAGVMALLLVSRRNFRQRGSARVG